MTIDVKTAGDDDPERLLISTEKEAAELAKRWKYSDPLKEVRNSLLSSEDIVEYAKNAGVVYPFFTGGGKASRLKRASYEGRLGSKAYLYKPGRSAQITEIEIPDRHGSLRVPPNSIVFVECDLKFRLPTYIAIRYNLQIRHVHRGLLLGTGPLVDPGYWGCLCIPLHNLTSEEYIIPRNEGLIWVEFTKTSSLGKQGVDPLQKATELKSSEDDYDVTKEGYWNARAFIERSAKSLVDDSVVPIRSSIPEAVAKASDKAESALKSVDSIRNIGFIAGLAIGVAIVVSVPAFLQSYNSIYQQSKDYVDASVATLQTQRDRDIDDLIRSRDTLSLHLESALRRIEQLEASIPSPNAARQGLRPEGAADERPRDETSSPQGGTVP